MRSLTPKTLAFPLAGVARRGDYRRQERPYATPYAVNVRGVGVIESRLRGGSRPGLSRVGAVSTATVGAWQWPNGEPIEWETDSDVEYLLSEDVITGPDGTLIFDPASLISVVAKKGAAPSSYGMSCVYRDRVILAADSMWYASRMGDHGDFDYGADFEDAGRAVAGGVGSAGKAGSDITALIPFRDSHLVIATANALYVMSGDPVDGRVDAISEEVGIVSPFAWAMNDGTLAFLSNDGVYIGEVGKYPKRFSEQRMPEELRNVDADSNTVLMAYDPTGRGFHLFITPEDGTSFGHHYWLDPDNGAVWPVVFANSGHQPVAACRIDGVGLGEVALKGRDGVWRRFDAEAETDDGTVLTSTVVIGPVQVSPNDTDDAVLAEISGILAAGSGAVTWGVSMGDSAEDAADKAAAGTFAATGTWAALRNPVDRPRLRGTWAAVSLISTEAWSYEAVVLVARQLGRLRV